MVFTNAGKQFVTWALGSDVGKYISYVGIGSGSGTALVTDETLTAETNRVAITGSPSFATREVTFQADLNSIQMSGTTLFEWGLFDQASGTGFAGSVWQRETIGSVVFDGTNELQILSTLQVI